MRLTSKKAAEYLGIHINSLKRIPRERLPYIVVFKRGDRRYLLEDLKRYLKSNEQ